MMLARFFNVISLGGRPLKPGMDTTSSSRFSSAIAEPNLTLSSSACFFSMEQPSFTSSVIISPPKGITAVWHIIPSLKIAISVVPPPISTKTTPASFSSSLSTASAEAKGSSISASTSKPAFLTHLTIFRAAVVWQVIIWKFASNETPSIPLGCLIPGSPSTM